MVSRSEEVDDPNGELVRFRHEVVVGGTRMLTTGVRDGDSLIVTSQGQGFTNEKRLAWENGAVGQAVLDEHVRRFLAEGQKEFSIQTFDHQLAAFRTSRYVVRGEKQDVIQGLDDTFVILEQYDGDADHPVVTSWLDGHYHVSRVVLQQMGMEILIERVTPEALAGLELDPNFDVIRGSMIACDGYPEDPASVDEVEFRLVFSRPVEHTDRFNGPNQKLVSADADTVVLLVTREIANQEHATKDELDAYLRSDRHIQSDHPEIRAVADSIAAAIPAGGGTEALMRESSRWVNGHIRKKGFGQGFASAVDVLRTGEGDCTEHSVLLTAVLRAAGVPARTAVGLVYSEGSMIGHMWAEAYSGCWRSVDVLDPGNNPVRIRIAVSSDEKALDEKDVANAYSLVGGVAVDVLRFELREQD
jgi:hypothetical protein